MANKIIIKKSSVAGKVPLPADLEVGELAVNLADRALYSKDAGGAVVQLGGGSGSGDVVGPSSATDNAIPRYDGTTGKLIQNSGVTIDDNDNVIDPRSIQLSGNIPAAPTPGTLWFDATTDTLNLQQNAITQQVGEELFVYGKASSAISGETILQAIYKTGTVGASGVITFAPTISGITDGGLIIGVGTENIATNGFGRVTNFGIVHGINTTGSTYSETWADGDDIWYNPTTGGLTKTKPSAPNVKVQIGTIIHAGSGGSGSFQVLLNAGSSLGGTDDNVQITSPTSGNALIYDATAGYWKNANITAGTGISVTNGAGSISIANTGVTSVTGTSPVASSGGATPAISLASAYGDTQNPYGSKTANYFLAAPNGSAGSPSFRAIVAADIPTLNQNTTGTAAGLSSTLAIASGGTGATSAAAALTALGAQAAATAITTSNIGSQSVNYATSAGNADTLDGQHGAYYQPASTAITTSNIGSQSVNYATSAGSATSATTAGSCSGNAATVTNGFYTTGGQTVTDITYMRSANNSSTAYTAASLQLREAQGGGSGSYLAPRLAFHWGGVVASQIGIRSDGGIQILNNPGTAVENLWAANIYSNGTQVVYNSGTWSINVTGSAGSASTATTATTANGVAAGVVAGKMIYDSFTATAAQTTFTPSATYTSGKIEVYANGIKMVNASDVTVTSGTSVVFASGLAVGTRVDLVYPT